MLAQTQSLTHSSSQVNLDESFSVLKISTDLQSELIRQLNSQKRLEDMLGGILQQVEAHLRTDASSLYMLEDHPQSDAGERTARMRAARGYHTVGLKKGAFCRVIPREQIVSNPSVLSDKLGLAGWVISTGRSFLAKSPEEVITHPHWRGDNDEKQLPGREIKLAAFLGVPIRDLQGRIIGGLKAERLEGHGRFSIEDQITLEALARVSGRCISYFQSMRQEGNLPDGLNAAVVSWALDVIHEADATEGELDAFLDIVARLSAAVAEADGCAIFLIDEENRKALTQRAGYGSQRLRKAIRSYLLPEPGQLAFCRNIEVCEPATCPGVSMPRDQRVGLTVWVAVTGKSFYAPNFTELKKHCHHRGAFDKVNFEVEEQCGAWLGMPLRVGGAVIGMLKVENVAAVTGDEKKREFSLLVQQRFEVLAAEIALSIKRLQFQNKDRYKVIEGAMPTIVTILQGGFDIPELVKKVVQETAKLFDARACALFLKEGNELIQADWAAYGWAGLGKNLRRYRLIDEEKIKDFPNPQEKVGLTVWIAVKKKKFSAKSNLELISHPHHKGIYDPYNFQGGELCESFMGVPMLLNEGKELVGVLKVETKQKVVEGVKEFSYFNEQDELVFELIANIAAIAIQNARLLEARRLSERVLTQRSMELVFRELYHFITGREDVLHTLDETIQILRPQNETRAKFVGSFAGLLDPRFPERILEEVCNSVSGSSQEALGIFLQSLRVKNVSEMVQLSRQLEQQEIGGLLSSSFFLHEFIRNLITLSKAIGDHLQQYQKQRENTAHLTDSLGLVAEEEEKAPDEYLFERLILNRILEQWRTVIQTALNEFRVIRNPYVAGLPLEPGSKVFFGREEIFAWIERNICDAQEKNTLVLHGGWHIGKTSILRQIEGPAGKEMRDHSAQPIFPVYIDLQGIPDPGTGVFLLNLAERIGKSLGEQGLACPPPDLAEFAAGHAVYRAFDAFLDQIHNLLQKQGDGVLVLMLDEFELLDKRVQEGKIDNGIFAYLRNKVQHQKWIILILAGRHRLDEMTPEFKTMFYIISQRKEVTFLSSLEATSLIRNPVKDYAVTYSDAVVDEMIRLTGGHPYFIQQICRKCIDLLNEQKKSRDVTRQELNQALDEMVRSNPILESLWKFEIEENARLILSALAHWGDGANLPMPVPDLLASTGLTAAALETALDSLRVKQIIEEKDGGYAFVIQMMRDWVKRNID